jgi:predicted nucleic acid-binding protein
MPWALTTASPAAALERRGTRIEDFDAGIAAHALVIDATLVTTNLDQMARVPGLLVEDWNR